ncbi:hypothetical protein D3C76_1396740 [compost metagenome]
MQLLFARMPVLQQPGAQGRNRVARHRSRFFSRIHVAIGIAEVVPVKPEGVGLDQGRAAAVAGTLDGVARDCPHGQRIITVDRNTRHGVAGGAIRDARAGRAVFILGMFGVAVVLADKYHRELPHRGQVERFVEGADIARAVAEIGD